MKKQLRQWLYYSYKKVFAFFSYKNNITHPWWPCFNSSLSLMYVVKPSSSLPFLCYILIVYTYLYIYINMHILIKNSSVLVHNSVVEYSLQLSLSLFNFLLATGKRRLVALTPISMSLFFAIPCFSTLAPQCLYIRKKCLSVCSLKYVHMCVCAL